MSKSRTGKKSQILVALATLLLALGLAACGGDSDSGSTSGETTAATSGGGGEKDQVSVAMEVPITEEFWLEEKAGGDFFAAEDGNVDMTITGPPTFDPEAAQTQALNNLSKGQDAMGVVPQPAELYTRTMKTLSEELPGKAMVFGERPVANADEASTASIKTMVGQADKQISREMIEEAIKIGELPKTSTGEIIFGQCVAGETGTPKLRQEGLVEGAENLLPNATIVEIVSETDPQVNSDRYSQAIAAHPDTILAAGTCAMDGPSLYKLKKANNYDFVVGAMDMAPTNGEQEAIESGAVQAVMNSNSWFVGYTVARMLTEAARGAELPEGFISTGGSLFTKANAAEISVRQNEPEKFYKPNMEEMFANGMPEAGPIEDAWK